jgi:hypothetical protein
MSAVNPTHIIAEAIAHAHVEPELLTRIQAVVMMADIDITSGDRPHATDAQYRAIAQRLLDKVVAPERLAAAVMATPPRKKAGTCTCKEGMACSNCSPASEVES